MKIAIEKEVLEQVLEAIEESRYGAPCNRKEVRDAVSSLSNALSQPAAQQEPSPDGVMFAVEQAIKNGNCSWEIEAAFEEYERERQAAPQPAVPLTEPELRAVLEKTNHMIVNAMRGPFWPELEQACRAVEAAHKIGTINSD
jgi:hypothetical protein